MNFLSAVIFLVATSPVLLANVQFLCDFINTTDVTDFYAEWRCSSDNPETDPCVWRGVSCLGSSSDEIEELNLAGLRISGGIPNSLQLLSVLRKLDLSGNYLYSNIADSISLTAAESIILNDNNLYIGELLNFSNMPKLETLDLARNRLSLVPHGIWKISSLQFLDISYNLIEAIIPGAIGTLTNLRVLSLRDNSFYSTLPETLWQLSRLEGIHLSNNALTSTLPDGVGNLYNLDTLRLENNFLAGPFPSALGTLTKLLYIGLSNNMLTSSIPNTLDSLKHLLQLTVANNSMTGVIPYSLCNTSTLIIFDGNGNRFQCYPSCLLIPHLVLDYNTTHHCPGDQDIAICDLESAFGMSSVIASASFIGDVVEYGTAHPIPAEDASFDFAVSISGAAGYDITFDPFMATFFYGNATVTICVNGKCSDILQDDYPGTYFGNPALHIARSSFTIQYTVSVNEFVPIAPYGFHMYVTPVSHGTGWTCSLDLFGNVVAVGLCEPNNPWTGVTCLYNAAVSDLNLKALGVTGRIPSTLINMKSITNLDISFNSLSGTIPESVFIMSSLEYLDISNNYLTGPLPLSKGDNYSIVGSGFYWIFLDQNLLTGSLPSVLTKVEGLARLKLDGNDFSGKLPTSYCESNETMITLSHNPHLCYSKCWTESHPADVADDNICTSTPKDNIWTSAGLIAVYSVVGLILFILLGSLVYLRWKVSRVHPEGVERARRLAELPVHNALILDVPRGELVRAIKNHKATAKERDYDGSSAIDIVLSASRPPASVDVSILMELVLDCLPINMATERYVEDPTVHVWAWPKLVQSSTRLCTDTVEAVVNMHKKYIELLAGAEDIAGRRSIDIASPECKYIISKAMYLYERFELIPGPPEHISQTCVVRFAHDHGIPEKRRPRPSAAGGLEQGLLQRSSFKGEVSQHVALKFMKFRDQFNCELDTRRIGDFDKDFVVSVKMSLNGDQDEKFKVDASLKGYEQYPYCLVLDAADGNLQRKVAQQHIAGKDWDKIRYIVLNLVNALRHMHSKGFVHGDLKPMNILPVNDTMKLTDFDAAAGLQAGSYVGAKYSSAYVPPELLWRSPTGDVMIRTFARDAGGRPVNVDQLPYSLVPASIAHDMWALGAITYLLCTGNPIFLSNVETDNVADQEDLVRLLEWSPEIKLKKLSNIANRFAQNLVSVLLTKDPTKRPDCDHVLAHPFLTGKAPMRLQGEDPAYDIFMSYRVASDSDIVELLYSALTARGYKVWVDRMCLPPGLEWEKGFCEGLMDSGCFVCILSREAINSRDAMARNVTTLNHDSICDNVLLEWRLALELTDRGMLRGIYPVMVGDKEYIEDNVLYGDYFVDGCHPSHAENVVLLSVEEKLREHLDREGLGLPLVNELGVKDILARITKNQGGFVRGEFNAALEVILDSIAGMVENSRK